MKAKTLVVLLLVTTSIALLHPRTVSVKAASGNPSFVVLFANFGGWNSTVGTTNPGFTESVGGKFTLNIQFDDNAGITHDIGIYTNGTTAGGVSTLNSCSTSSTSGCLAKSVPITYPAGPVAANLTFTPQPSAVTGNLGGTGGFEYFCQYHPFSMHGHITVLKNFSLLANVAGWNSTSVTNPAFKEFAGVKFRVNIQFSDISGQIHDFAIYTNATTAGSVSPANSCSTSNTNGCLSRSVTVSANSPSGNVNFTALLSQLPPNFGGPGGFEYFCQYHPFSMHGHITVNKDPDITGPSGTPDHVVNILDIATIAFAFGSTALPSPTPKWNVAADLDNNGVVDILDVALDAFYFGRTF